MMPLERARAWSRILAVGALLAPQSAWAAGDPRAGAEVALRWCTACHLVRPAASGPAVQGPPAFQTIARERTTDALRAFLTRPHPPMPPIELSRADIDNLIAYIDTQR
jgi:mono/diheme cytochrome c family protein